jgi:uncharacterized protein YukE
MPPNEIRADPVELTRMAGVTLSASQQLADAWGAAQGKLAVPGQAFGNASGPGFHQLTSVYPRVSDGAGPAVEALTAVLENDTDALYRTAFAYRKADDDAAAKLARQHRNIPL